MTLRLLQAHGYERMTLDAVAAEAKASKATMYKRWPSKAHLVLAAFTESFRAVAVPAHSGSLRGDLLAIGDVIREEAQRHSRTVRAVLAELPHSPALAAVLQHELVCRRRSLIIQAYADAATRGEIDARVITDELVDVLPGYLVYRFLILGRAPTAETVRALVDEVLLPSLSRTRANYDMPR